jgi:hypothetical protein
MEALLYTRVSKEDQVKYGMSLESQLDDLQRYCSENHLKVRKVYSDEGISGGSIKKRLAFQNMIAESRPGDIILFTKLDRFSRNLLDANITVQELDKKNVEIRGCEKTQAILGSDIVPATEEDYATEFLDYIIAIKVVDSLDDAIDHIAKFSSGHSECIVTSDYASSEKFTACVDSAAVYVNASTRFTDGGEFGLGAEIGISTQKLHARGPMGLNELTSNKFIILGNGQIR